MGIASQRKGKERGLKMTEKDARRKLAQLPLSTLREEFVMNFEVNHLCRELMDKVAPTRLKKFVIDNIVKEYTQDEIAKVLNKKSERR